MSSTNPSSEGQFQVQTRLAQAGNHRDPATGAVSMPIYHSTTYSHPELGHSTGFDYSRLANPTRKVLEETIADLEGGVKGFAFSSGMAAIHCVCQLLRPGDHVIISNDLYGGTYRLFEQILKPLGVSADYVDTGEEAVVESLIRSETRALFIETPTNPTMQISNLRALVEMAHARDILVIVDNTFMSPYFQQPILLGADLVVHSATKFLGGHNDVLAGLVVAKDAAVAERIYFYQNAIGAVLGPQDSWLLLRGMKTLALRMEAHDKNARELAEWLSNQSEVTKVYYPGLSSHPRREVHESQSTGYGGMISFEVADAQWVPRILQSLRLITFAESLGGVESLITFPAVQTHADIPAELRDAVGVTDRLLRLSVGIEHVEDLKGDLAHALKTARLGSSK